jgi:hypothetical protein
VIPVLATVGAHFGENTERRFVTLVGDQRKEVASRGRGGGGNHGQVVVVTIDCLCVSCVCCVLLCVVVCCVLCVVC